MQCGIYCIAFLLDYYEVQEYLKKSILENANAMLNEQGLSIYDLVNVLQYAFHCYALKAIFIPNALPCILYLGTKRKTGHYLIVMKRTLFSFIVFDGEYGYKKLNKLRLYLFWSHICILCYNKTKRGT